MRMCKISDQDRDNLTGPPLIGVYDIYSRSYTLIRELQVARNDYAFARYRSLFFFF